MSVHIIGLHGKKYTGKDTAALGLIEHGYTRLAFADPLRDLLYDINPIVAVDNRGRIYRWQEVWDTEGYDYLKTLPEARRLMQEVGTRIRERDPDFWVRLARQKIEPAGVTARWVITDVRFDNEARMVRQFGGQVVEVVRDTSNYDDHGANHVSEAGITRSLIDYTVYNESSVADLHEKIRSIAGV
jgi:hypothetical protein